MNSNPNLPNGIFHGPYDSLAKREPEVYELYLSDPERFGAAIDMSLEQYIADRESESQYDMHTVAVGIAASAIDPETGKPRISTSVEAAFIRRLRPWFIYSRRPGNGEYESQF
jgi:hypothetical protein